MKKINQGRGILMEDHIHNFDLFLIIILKVLSL